MKIKKPQVHKKIFVIENECKTPETLLKIGFRKQVLTKFVPRSKKTFDTIAHIRTHHVPRYGINHLIRTENIPKIQHFLPPDTHTCDVCGMNKNEQIFVNLG